MAYSLRDGWRQGCLIACAPLMTDAPIIGLSLLALVAFSDASGLLVAIQAAGGIYLLYLALLTWQSASALPDAGATVARPLRDGLVVNWLNPHPWLFWFTVGAPFMRNHAEAPLYIGCFLLTFYTTLVGSKIAVAVATARSRTFLRQRGYVYVMRSLGVVLAGFGVRALVSLSGS